VGLGIGVKVAIGKDVGVGVGVSENARVAVTEKTISGGAGEPSGNTVGLTGVELQATHSNHASNKITNNLRRIGHLIGRDILLSLYASNHARARHNLHA
jgi:hypothetical protein